MEDIFRFADELGPIKIVHIYEPSVGMKGIVAVDNIACGPAIGGVRMAPDVSIEEAFRLARAMTFKNAAAGLPHGGGKSVIFGDPKMPEDKKEKIIRAFACAIRDITEYIPGPDMGTNEKCMAWVKDEIGRAVGLPSEIGGIPLDEIGATGLGVAISAEVAKGFCDLDLKGARVVIQGFGNVGKHAARFLGERGTLLVAAADSSGAVYNAAGLDVNLLIEHKNSGKTVADFPGGKKLESNDVIGIECDILVPAARPDVIHAHNLDSLNTKLIVPGANIAVTHDAEEILHKKGILVIPDFIANAGGVICAATEYEGGTEAQALENIKEKIHKNTVQVLESSGKNNITPRQAAFNLSRERVKAAGLYHRWSCCSQG